MRVLISKYKIGNKLYYSVDLRPDNKILEAQEYTKTDELPKHDAQEIIKVILSGRNQATRKYERFAKKSVEQKIFDLFYKVTKPGGDSGSRYAKFTKTKFGTNHFLRVADHVAEHDEHIIRNLQKPDIDGNCVQFIFFDNTNPKNVNKNKERITYSDGIQKPRKVNLDNGNERLVYEFDIDSEHLKDRNEFMKVVDALVQYFKTGTFTHPFTGNSSEAVKESRGHAKEYWTPYSDLTNPLFRNRDLNPNWNPYRCLIIGC